MTEQNRRHEAINEDTQPAVPTEGLVAQDPNEQAEPVATKNSFFSNKQRQEDWLMYLKSQGKDDEAAELQKEIDEHNAKAGLQ